MARISMPTRAALNDFEPMFQAMEQRMGFLSNNLLLFARHPPFLKVVAKMVKTVFALPHLPPDLKWFVATVSSHARACRYCEAHVGYIAASVSGQPEKVAAVFDFQTSPLFSEAEKAALSYAVAASQVPSEATDEQVETLKKYYDEAAIYDLTAMIAFMAFLNCWSDAMDSDLEAVPTAFATEHLSASGWKAE